MVVNADAGEISGFAIFTVVETTLGVICASLPVLRPLAGKALGHFTTRVSEINTSDQGLCE